MLCKLLECFEFISVKNYVLNYSELLLLWSCYCRIPPQIHLLKLLVLFFNRFVFSSADGDENEENICGRFVRSHNAGRCQELLRTIRTGKWIYSEKTFFSYFIIFEELKSKWWHLSWCSIAIRNQGHLSIALCFWANFRTNQWRSFGYDLTVSPFALYYIVVFLSVPV